MREFLNPWLPLMNVFRNQKIEMNVDLNELKNLFEILKPSQVTTTTIAI